MTVSPSVLLISVSIGVPLMLLALGVLYHAHLLGQQPEDVDAHVEQLATNPDEVMRGLQRSMNDIRGELTRQRASLRGMLSEQAAAEAAGSAMTAAMPSAMPSAMPAGTMTSPTHSAPAPAAPMAPAPEMMQPPTMAQMPAAPLPAPPTLPIDRTAGELRAAVHDLAAEGLSDRSIARRLRIGLEEVRLARASGGGSQRPA